MERAPFEAVAEHLGLLGPAFADDADHLEARAMPARPVGEQLRERVVELLVGVDGRREEVVVDLAEGGCSHDLSGSGWVAAPCVPPAHEDRPLDLGVKCPGA